MSVLKEVTKYTRAALEGRLFFSYCAARATSIPATAQIGNIVWNPPGSGVNLVMLKWNAQVEVESATTLGITFGVSEQATRPTTPTVADVAGCTFLNPPTFTKGMAEAFAIGTIVTAPSPVFLCGHNTATIAITGADDQLDGDFEGMFIIPPGNVAALSAITAAVAAAGMTSTLVWEESPVGS